MKKKRYFQTILVMAMLAVTLLMPTGNIIPSTTITAEAATSTAVKALAKGKSYTLSGYAKVKSSSKSVATATKKSSKKYTIKAKKAGRTTLTCHNASGKVVKKIYLIVTTSGTIKYNTSAVTLSSGKTKTVKATVQSGCTVKYTSSDKSVATVSSKGKITAKKAGTATITATAYYKGKKIKTAKKTVKVVTSSSSTTTAQMEAEKQMTTASSTASVTYESTTTLSYSGLGSGTTWETSSSNVSLSSTTGSSIIITGANVGTATVTATDSTNYIKITFTVTVNQETITDSTSLTSGGTATLSPSGISSSAKWTTSDSMIASLGSTTGSSVKITAGKAGTATVVADDGNTKATYTVTVSKKTSTATASVTAGEYVKVSSGMTSTACWTVDNSNVISISGSTGTSSGTVYVSAKESIYVTGISAGTVTLTVEDDYEVKIITVTVEANSSSGGSTASGVIGEWNTSTTVSGGGSASYFLYCTSGTIDLSYLEVELTADSSCVAYTEISDVMTGTLYSSGVNIYVHMQTQGYAYLTVKYDGTTYLNGVTITCTSDNTNYTGFLTWVTGTVETSDYYTTQLSKYTSSYATPIAKIRAFADYIAYNYMWYNDPNMYCFQNGEPGNCVASTGAILTYIRYLNMNYSYGVTAWSSNDGFEDTGHVYVKFTYGGTTYRVDAGFSRTAYWLGAEWEVF